jgi:hypothetical protein
MTYVMRSASFDTELHARWSLFFDQVGVRWLYHPTALADGDSLYSPAFFLPQYRLWVEARSLDDGTPSWWDSLVATVEFWCEECGVHQPCPGNHPAVGGLERHWLGQTLLLLGPLPHGRLITGPKVLWEASPALAGGGATGEMPPSGDEYQRQLLRAYEFAASEWIGGHLGDPLTVPVVLEAVISGTGATSDQPCACGAAFALSPPDQADVGAGLETGEAASHYEALSGCSCYEGTSPTAAAAPGYIRPCDITSTLTDRQARGLLNDMAWKLGKLRGAAPNIVNNAINREIGARHRSEAGLNQIVAGLNAVETWLEDPERCPIPASPAAQAEKRGDAETVLPPQPVSAVGWTGFTDLERRYAPVKDPSVRKIKPQGTSTVQAPIWSTDPCLFDAFMRLWVRWAHGVPVNWTREECTVLTDVILKGLNVEPTRRGSRDLWRTPASEPRIGLWRADELLGYVLDSIDHGFSCNLTHDASFQVLELAGRACGRLSLFGEAHISHQIWELTRAWRSLRSPERIARARNINFVIPHSSYRASTGARQTSSADTRQPT